MMLNECESRRRLPAFMCEKCVKERISQPFSPFLSVLWSCEWEHILHNCHLSLNVYLPVTAAKCLIGLVIREPLPRAVESAGFWKQAKYWIQTEKIKRILSSVQLLIWERLLPEAAFNGVGKSPHQPHFLSEALAGNLTSVRMKKQSYYQYIKELVHYGCK